MLNQTMLPARMALIVAVLAILASPLVPPPAFADSQARPDLVVANARVDDDPFPAEFTVGDRVTIRASVTNVGGGPAGRSRLAYHIGNYSPGRLFDTDSVRSLNSGRDDDEAAKYTFTEDDVGTQYFKLVADHDSEVDEESESNNTTLIGPFTVMPERHNRAHSESGYEWSWSLSDSRIDVGDSVYLKVRVYDVAGRFDHGGVSVSFPDLTSRTGGSSEHVSSRGDVTVGSTSGGVADVDFFERGDEVYSSRDRRIDARHLLVESHNSSWDSSSDRTLGLWITPKRSGRFDIHVRTWLCRDGWTDCDRHPTRPDTEDQQGWGAELLTIDVSTAGGPDLVVQNATVDDDPSPSEFTVGDTVTIRASVTNIGGGPAGRSRLGYEVGDSSSGRLVDTDSVGSLDPGGDDDESATYTFTEADVGSSYFRLVADHDSEVDEQDESNNTTFIGPFTVISEQRDRTGSVDTVSISCSPVAVEAGEIVTCHPDPGGNADIEYTWGAVGGTPEVGHGEAFSTSWFTSGRKTLILDACIADVCVSHTRVVAVDEASVKSPPRINDLGCSPSAVDEAEYVVCRPDFSAGGPVRYTWRAAGGTPSAGDSRSFRTRWASAGSQSITLKICNGHEDCVIEEQNISVGQSAGTDGSGQPESRRLTAHVEIEHSWVGDLEIWVGAGPDDDPLWVRPLRVRSSDNSSDNTEGFRGDFDLGYVRHTLLADNVSWWLKVTDHADGDFGSIARFAIGGDGLSWEASDLPLSISDHETSYAYTSNSPWLRTVLVVNVDKNEDPLVYLVTIPARHLVANAQISGEVLLQVAPVAAVSLGAAAVSAITCKLCGAGIAAAVAGAPIVGVGAVPGGAVAAVSCTVCAAGIVVFLLSLDELGDFIEAVIEAGIYLKNEGLEDYFLYVDGGDEEAKERLVNALSTELSAAVAVVSAAVGGKAGARIVGKGHAARFNVPRSIRNQRENVRLRNAARDELKQRYHFKDKAIDAIEAKCNRKGINLAKFEEAMNSLDEAKPGGWSILKSRLRGDTKGLMSNVFVAGPLIKSGRRIALEVETRGQRRIDIVEFGKGTGWSLKNAKVAKEVKQPQDKLTWTKLKRFIRESSGSDTAFRDLTAMGWSQIRRQLVVDARFATIVDKAGMLRYLDEYWSTIGSNLEDVIIYFPDEVRVSTRLPTRPSVVSLE